MNWHKANFPILTAASIPQSKFSGNNTCITFHALVPSDLSSGVISKGQRGSNTFGIWMYALPLKSNWYKTFFGGECSSRRLHRALVHVDSRVPTHTKCKRLALGAKLLLVPKDQLVSTAIGDTIRNLSEVRHKCTHKPPNMLIDSREWKQAACWGLLLSKRRNTAQRENILPILLFRLRQRWKWWIKV